MKLQNLIDKCEVSSLVPARIRNFTNDAGREYLDGLYIHSNIMIDLQEWLLYFV